jgi:hypothetical protein
MDCLLWLEKEKSDCNGKWIDEIFFPVGEKTKGTCNIRFYIFQEGSHKLFDFLKLVFKNHIFVICHRIFHMN